MKAFFFKRRNIFLSLLITGLFAVIFIANNQTVTNALAIRDFNFGFETVSNPAGLPDGWGRWGHPSYNFVLDSAVKHSGRYSLRIEHATGIITDGEFGCPRFSIPAVYEGTNITLKAFMRTEGVENPIGLLLRIDGSSSSLQFDNMMQRGITGSGEWTEYSVSLPLPQEAQMIHIGAILSGVGKLWIDDFQLLIDGEDISKAALKQNKAEEDNEYDAGSRIAITSYTPQTVANLELLGRIWGFLKYYHPAVAAGDYNWDAELFRIMPTVINAQNSAELNKIFEEWIDRMETPRRARRTIRLRRANANIKLQPDLAWIENQELGRSLSRKLIAVKNAARSGEHYYIALFPNVNNPNFRNERPYAQMNYSDDSGMRLLALFRYWNMIEYFFPYKHLTDENWNTVLGKFIPKFLDAGNELDYKLALIQLIAHINDTHANIYNDRAIEAWKGANRASYDISFVEGKAVVTGIWSNNLSPVLKIGDVITQIDGKTVETFVEERKPFSPASNPVVQLRNISNDLLRTNADKISLQIIRNGSPQTCEITNFTGRPQSDTQRASHRLLSPDVGYIFPETLRNDSIPYIMEKFKDTRGIVIDFRGYPRNDFTVFTLGAWLTPQPTDFVKFTNGNIQQPGLFTFTQPLKVGANNERYYRGKVVIIVNERTQSSAEYHSMAFQTAPQSTTIGNITAAADGNVSPLVLPGNVQTIITGIGVYYPDGRETQRVGIDVDEEVKPTIRGIIEGRDELLERAIMIICQ